MMVKCGVVQFNHRPGEKAANFKIIEHYAAAAFAAGVKVLALPEMCLTGYWHARHLDRDGWVALSERIPEGPWCQALIALADRFDMAIGVGLVEQAEDGRLFNTYAVAMPDGRLHRHRKIHAFESRHVSSGDGYTVFDTPWGVRLGVLICWDNNLVENVRATALLGADILLAPHQTGATDSRSPHGMRPIDPLLWHRRTEDPERLRAEFQGEKGRGWLMRWLPSRAHDNGMFLLFANAVGEDDGEVRTGNAMILDPYGRTLVESTSIDDDMVTADLDLDLLPLSTGRRWIRGRRPVLYGILSQPLGHELSPLEARFSSEPVRRP